VLCFERKQVISILDFGFWILGYTNFACDQISHGQEDIAERPL
jgi:hypothetical protein